MATQKEKQKLVFKTDYRLMQVKSVAQCFKRAFCNTFDLIKLPFCLKDLCFVHFELPLNSGFTVDEGSDQNLDLLKNVSLGFHIRVSTEIV